MVREIGDIGALQQHIARQLTLHAEIDHLHLRWMGIVFAHESCGTAIRHCRVDRRVRIESRRKSVIPVGCRGKSVDGRYGKSRHKTLPVPKLSAKLTYWGREQAITTAHYCLVRQLICEAKARPKTPGVSIREPALSVAARALSQKGQRARQASRARIGNVRLEL